MDKIWFANLIIRGLSLESILNFNDGLKFIITVNSEIAVLANEEERLKKIINENWSTFDGQVPFLFAKLMYPKMRIEKISGSDLIYTLSEYAAKNQLKVFLLGGYPESNQISVNVLGDRYNIEIEGYSPPYQPYPFDEPLNRKMIMKISQFSPDILFVAFGAKKQEYWIDDNREALQDMGVKWVIGCGGTFEMVAGRYKRAPKMIQQLALEGVHRFIQEPKWFRLIRIFHSFKIFKYMLVN